ncbi:Uncharacterised protein [Pseudomonas putida]|nr:Uncharacterised protein [Pseudomonas putida]
MAIDHNGPDSPYPGPTENTTDAGGTARALIKPSPSLSKASVKPGPKSAR